VIDDIINPSSWSADLVGADLALFFRFFFASWAKKRSFGVVILWKRLQLITSVTLEDAVK
jgi:hypothetical protein